MPKVKAVITVMGRDQKGVVARFATFVADRGINIEDVVQQVVHGQFIMDMLVDVADMTITLDEMIMGLLETGQAIGMQVRVSLHGRGRRKRIALLVSKEPHCLERLISDAHNNKLRGELAVVLSNHPELEPIARAAGIPFYWKAADDKQAHFDWLLKQMQSHEIELAVLARYMQIVPPAVVQAFRHRIINIHPSLLPHFPGAAPYKQAWESGVRVTGCTAHFVTEALDQGPIILQDVFHIDVGKDTAEDVKRKGLALEAQVLSQATQMFLDEKLVVVDDKVVFRPGLSSFLDHAENGA